MKIMHVPYCFYPDPVGGTEVYVAALCKYLMDSGAEVLIAAPTLGEGAAYKHEDIRVRRFNCSANVKNLADLYGKSDPVGTKEFIKILDEEKPDILHIHAFTHAISLDLVREAKMRNIPVIFTYHTPTISCQAGLLMIWKKKACRGVLNTRTCTTCTLYRFNVPRGLGDALSMMPRWVNTVIEKNRLSGKIFTALRMRWLIDARMQLLKRFIGEIDFFIALCKWTEKLLLDNNIPGEKIALIRHGTHEHAASGAPFENISPYYSPLKIVYLGRIDYTKGLEFAIQALALLPEAKIKFDIYGITQGEAAERYLKKLKKETASDKRISFLPAVSNAQAISSLKNYHYLVIPSIWMETGPLVALEAFATGTPVIGSDIGGICELVKNEHNGLLVKLGSVRAWKNVLEKVSDDRELLVRMRGCIEPPRTMRQVSIDNLSVYKKILSA